MPRCAASPKTPRRSPLAVAALDGWRRHPQLSVPGFMRFCDYFGTWVFAISGTLTAATSGLDLLGCVVVGSITALGGGTARDMIMGQVPPCAPSPLLRREFIVNAGQARVLVR
jgi:uncharacterized membrane protein YeiH